MASAQKEHLTEEAWRVSGAPGADQAKRVGDQANIKFPILIFIIASQRTAFDEKEAASDENEAAIVTALLLLCCIATFTCCFLYLA